VAKDGVQNYYFSGSAAVGESHIIYGSVQTSLNVYLGSDQKKLEALISDPSNYNCVTLDFGVQQCLPNRHGDSLLTLRNNEQPLLPRSSRQIGNRNDEKPCVTTIMRFEQHDTL
jgi:hypothetical protein